MDRPEAMERFRNGEAAEEINRILLQMDSDLIRQKEKLAEQFIEEFQKACEAIAKMQEEGTLKPVASIFLIMLRSRLLESDGTMDIIAANQEGWFDKERKQAGTYHYHFMIPYWDQLRERLESERKKYVGKTMKQDVDFILKSQADKMLQYAAKIARYSFASISEAEQFREIKTEGELEVFIGEYLDAAEIICRRRSTKRNKKEQMELLERIADQREEELCVEEFRGMELSGLDFSEGDYRFADFRESRMEGVHFRASLLMGALFRKNRLDGSDFSHSILYEADFEGCSLRDCNFSSIIASMGQEQEGQWERAGYFNVNFCYADLSGADFRDSELKGADFRGSRLQGADFRGALLKEAVFDPEQMEGIELEGEQRAQVIVKNRALHGEEI